MNNKNFILFDFICKRGNDRFTTCFRKPCIRFTSEETDDCTIRNVIVICPHVDIQNIEDDKVFSDGTDVIVGDIGSVDDKPDIIHIGEHGDVFKGNMIDLKDIRNTFERNRVFIRCSMCASSSVSLVGMSYHCDNCGYEWLV